MDMINGIINISNDLIIIPNYSFESFKTTKHYSNQDGIRTINLGETLVIDGRKYLVNLFFRSGKIYRVALMCCDIEYTEIDEHKRKALHDAILQEYGIQGKGEYAWGRIESVYDQRGNVSSINIYYGVS